MIKIHIYGLYCEFVTTLNFNIDVLINWYKLTKKFDDLVYLSVIEILQCKLFVYGKWCSMEVYRVREIVFHVDGESMNKKMYKYLSIGV